jgi:hypothetical protein
MWKMELKKRTMPKELQLFSSLAPRFELSTKEKQTYSNLQKGYEGELMFDRIIADQLQCEYLIIKDLFLSIDSKDFQIDTLIIFPTIIQLFEVKNFEGEHVYDKEKDMFYKNMNYEIQNPEHQLSRAVTLLKRLLRQHGFQVNLQGTVTFVNPEFTLYNLTPDKPFILPTQINSLMRKFNQNYSGKITNQNKGIGKKLISLHQSDYPIKNIPDYTFEDLNKGITCHHCNSLSISLKGHYCYCKECGEKEKVQQAVVRSVQEFKILFPEEKVTKAKIFEWCGGMVSEQRTLRILKQHFQLLNRKRWGYYERKTASN